MSVVRTKEQQGGSLALYLHVEKGEMCYSRGIELDKPVASSILQANTVKMQVQLAFCEQREQQSKAVRNLFEQSSTERSEADFFEVFARFIMSYRRKDIKVVRAVQAHLRNFVGEGRLPVSSIDRAFCEDFLGYLYDTLRGNTPMGYFKKFRMCLERCVEDGMFDTNPARGIRLGGSEEILKEILSSEEMQRLADTPMVNSEVKRAFLFACYTGLRWCDVSTLRFKAIDFKRNMLTVCQRKVKLHSSKAVLHLNLNATTIALLRLCERKPDELVFRLPSYSYARVLLFDWVHRAGVQKHITFHCARHSFITNLMISGANIKTASVLAGHSTIRHTEKYVHIIDELKQKAVDSLPALKLSVF